MARTTQTQTLADLHYTQKLYASCGACHRSVPLSVRNLIEQFGPLFTIDELRRRIRCERCGRRTKDVRIVYSVAKR